MMNDCVILQSGGGGVGGGVGWDTVSVPEERMCVLSQRAGTSKSGNS